ncbi:hypothetical protein GGTG_06983 [Gaeumannomyces tritici R3-111a-1]|uniref:Uncharacterized protein n=1 Tax=Gaeumannomyces tritici (strain R3-111a-1) TaxID=644352 RepID=J3P0D6_GAET3|nr:hypothetical protein GGTG_06983 [Gaeumannomyces tritici R3-111a-1]EJT77069.1 hypothetical protein GGTG_06983 [Gaeumannomyces tritici R3-111a-1]
MEGLSQVRSTPYPGHSYDGSVLWIRATRDPTWPVRPGPLLPPGLSTSRNARAPKSPAVQIANQGRGRDDEMAPEARARWLCREPGEKEAWRPSTMFAARAGKRATFVWKYFQSRLREGQDPSPHLFGTLPKGSQPCPHPTDDNPRRNAKASPQGARFAQLDASARLAGLGSCDENRTG